ncbi:MAG: hypothetical protein ACTHL8_12955 [Burkholderiaceae bacterium]
MTAFDLSNRISLQIPAADMEAILAALRTLQEKLKPHLIDLGTENRRLLPRMGAKAVDFVARTLSQARANPHLKPTFVDIDEFSRDLAAVGVLRELQQPLAQLTDMVNDSVLMSGSEAYAAALACYQSFKAAAKLNQPGAASVAADLAAYFAGRGGKHEPPVAPIGGQGAAPSSPN